MNNKLAGSPSEDIVRLDGVRFAHISEPGRSLLLNAALVKTMTRNDSLTMRGWLIGLGMVGD